MQSFDYYTPQTLTQALKLLGQLNGQTRVIAGGTDLMLQMKSGLLTPANIINIKQVPQLNGIAYSEQSGLRLGALTTLRQLTRSSIIQKHYPCLSQTANLMASEQIRSFATLGGNLCNASPSADLAPPLIVLDALAHIAGPQGEREIPLAAFFLGPGKSALKAGELLQAITLPPPQGKTIYIKHAPRAYMDIAVVGVGIRLEITENICQVISIVLGAVGPTPLRAKQAEAELAGQPIIPQRINRAAKLAADEALPIDDVRASAWYRRRMVEVATRRGLGRVLESHTL